MKERSFLDTNVLVYADDLDARAKRHTARSLLRDALRTQRGVLSTQVLQEFFVIATGKLGVKAEVARRKVELLCALEVVRVDTDIILAAIDLHRLHGFSFWDALILRCAKISGCTRVLTEDLQDGREIEGLRIVNPFRRD